jgi:hypothetical protein
MNKERIFYLAIIAAQLLTMCYYFRWTTEHYAYIEDKFDIVVKHCP